VEGVADVARNILHPFCDEAADDFEVARHKRVGWVHFVHQVDYVCEVGGSLDAELWCFRVWARDVDDVYDGGADAAVD